MDAKKISELLEATELSDDAVFPVVDDGKTKKAKIGLIKGAQGTMTINVISTVPMYDEDKEGYVIPYAQVQGHMDVSIGNYVKDFNGDIWLIIGQGSGGLTLERLVRYIN